VEGRGHLRQICCGLSGEKRLNGIKIPIRESGWGFCRLTGDILDVFTILVLGVGGLVLVNDLL